MESTNLIHGICIKMGDYDRIPKLRFIKKAKSKRNLFKSLDQFFNLTIFEQTEGLASILISLYSNIGSNKAILEDIEKLVNIGDRFIDIYLDPMKITYLPEDSVFDVDTKYDGPGGVKFVYGKKNYVPQSMLSIWNTEITPLLEDKYLDIINCISKTINNPTISVEDDDLTFIDAFEN